jgi:hypothetical protein
MHGKKGASTGLLNVITMRGDSKDIEHNEMRRRAVSVRS